MRELFALAKAFPAASLADTEHLLDGPTHEHKVVAASLMDWEKIRHVPVEDDEGRLVGVISHRSLLRLVAQGSGTENPRHLTVDVIMKKNPKNVDCAAVGLDPDKIVEETVLYDGPTRGACPKFPRNVNTHAAIALAEKVYTGEEADRRAYLDFLELGGSKFPLEALREAGVDMRSPEPVEMTVRYFDRLLEQLKGAVDA